MKGKFITFEGCEGSGKSTQIRLLSQRLTEENIPHIVTREPGGSEVAEQIRAIILNKDNTAMCGECEALLYAAARIQHLKEIVKPALDGGLLVLCDRYVDSSFAYQGYARGLGVEFVADINSQALKQFPPDMTLFLNISPKDAFERKHGVDKNDRMELMGMEFHQKVYDGYKAVAQNNPRIVCVQCGGTKFETNDRIYNLLKENGII